MNRYKNAVKIKKERSILFKDEKMVKAILDGRKTQTRRCDGLDVVNENPNDWKFSLYINTDGILYARFKNTETAEIYQVRSPYGKSGDRLWVREDWNNSPVQCKSKMSEHSPRVDYPKVEDTEKNNPFKKLMYHEMNREPSLHKLYSASRLTLEVTEVFIERLHGITEREAIAEGVPNLGEPDDWTHGHEYRQSFQKLWNSIYDKKHPWESNPWVWVTSHKIKRVI